MTARKLTILSSGLLLAIGLAGCEGGLFNRRSAAPGGPLAIQNRQEPALSGNGRFLASLVEQDGKARVLLQEQPGGQVIPLRHLRGHEPQSSPALSWNGRYVAALLQQGAERVAMVEDRASGNLLRLPLPGGAVPLRLSLSPDGRRIAMQILEGGQSRVQLFDLSGQLEPDQPGGLMLQSREPNPAAGNRR